MRSFADTAATVIVRIVLFIGVIAGLGLQREVVVHQSQLLAQHNPEFADLRMPLNAMVSLIAAAGVTIALAMWVLVGKVGKRNADDPETEVWIDVLVWALIGAAVVSLVALVTLGVSTHNHAPAVMISFISIAVICCGVVTLVWILRNLTDGRQEPVRRVRRANEA